MKKLLGRLRAEWPDLTPQTQVMRVRECQKPMNRAAKIVGMARITHHDLHHLFATRCIESGVDIPTVSHWPGQKYGGTLAMSVYGHLRDAHSAEMTGRANFGASDAHQATSIERPVAEAAPAKPPGPPPVAQPIPEARTVKSASLAQV